MAEYIPLHVPELSEPALANNVEIDMVGWLKFACRVEYEKRFSREHSLINRNTEIYREVCELSTENIIAGLPYKKDRERAVELVDRLRQEIPELGEVDHPAIAV